jgi:Flp pilus assembly pilin Flp
VSGSSGTAPPAKSMKTPSPSSRRRMRRLARDGRGAIMTEYVVLLGTVCIGFAAAILGLGPSLVANYERSQAIVLSPFP